jgi:hypothetical protein
LPYIPTKLEIFSVRGDKELNLPFTNFIIIYSLYEMANEYRGKRCERKSEERMEHQDISTNLQAYEMLFRENSIKEMDLAKLNTGQPGPASYLSCLFSYKVQYAYVLI